jgi:hypothetical protein
VMISCGLLGRVLRFLCHLTVPPFFRDATRRISSAGLSRRIKIRSSFLSVTGTVINAAHRASHDRRLKHGRVTVR